MSFPLSSLISSIGRPQAARRLIRRSLFSVAAAACVASVGLSHAAQAAESGKVGLDLPLLTSPFWRS
jgi:ribose transport system substrate-binding protein